MADLAFLTRTRGFLRTQITNNHNKVTQQIATLSDTQLLCMKEKLKSVQKEIKQLDKEILNKTFDAAVPTQHDAELITCQSYEDKIIESLVAIEGKFSVSQAASVAGSGGSTAPAPNPCDKLKSPVVPLPTYGGEKHKSLHKFLYNFESAVDRFGHKDYNKFLLLQQQVTGRALALVSSLEQNKQSYVEAKKLLLDLLGSEEKQKFKVIKQLTEASLPYSKDHIVFLGEMRVIRDTIKTLNIGVDDFVQYFYWNAMNDTMQAQYRLATNKNLPTLKDMDDKTTEANERYETAVEKYKEKRYSKSEPTLKENSFSAKPKKTQSFAANINYSKPNEKHNSTQKGNENFRPCSLCARESGTTDHPIFKCNKFPTPKDKIAEINQHDGCKRCANFGHTAQNCKLYFKSPCKNCKQWHFSFLCDVSLSTKDGTKETQQAPKNEDDKKKKDKPQAVSNQPQAQSTANNVVWTDIKQSSSHKDSIIPTFTVPLVDSDSYLHAMKDSGSQENFVTEKAFKTHNFPIIKENIPLIVNGFNASREYTAKMIELNLSFGEKINKLEAIVIPDISVTLNLPKMGSVVKMLEDKGFKLADCTLTGDTTKIE